MHNRRLLPAALTALAATALLVAGCATASGTDWASVDTCSLLPETELAGLGLAGPGRPAGGPESSGPGSLQGCTWRPASSGGGGLPTSLMPPTQLMLLIGDGVYDQSSAAMAQEGGRAIDIVGRPAVVNGAADGVCSVSVDVDGAALLVIGPDGCPGAQRVAEVATGAAA
ncbi:DUF3558 family protein [Pseudonocardia sp. HH130630-07]|uniref:DUF3558 family protein n=1 Tax=Pseudonocardia sp. HH130630-07 TaxID=1690815 RepID=UPI000814F480|nr:DUF3558 family protein [Pseudonocardia sp. HH130630-07]ANY07882.1 hypothetical protein AFB00_18010 [Pseudonocardia sp. HH130630-07]